MGGKVKSAFISRLLSLTLGCCAAALAAVPAHAGEQDLLASIETRGEFVVGTEARYAPFEFVENGEIVGYSADVIARVMEVFPDVKLNRMDLPFQGILPGLQAKKFDYVVTSIVADKARYEKFALSAPIADATVALIKRKSDTSLNVSEDIAGKIVGTQAGSVPLGDINAFAEQLKAQGIPVKEVKTYVGFEEAYADLMVGRIDAVANTLPALFMLKQKRPDDFEVVQPAFGPSRYITWAARRDEDSATLIRKIDERLQELNKSGVLAELQKKWIGSSVDLPLTLPAPQ
ncbi:polar amino acid transport system substrate-binding protein [Aminobacter niigataensis]|uniref:Polar amino acid transport system substrate-binding protein n=1 Tax=Aminobacter niigataensis TaxID=83265 RepID=A0ABR6L4F0_9HYPH|nr:polar amino acid transport system substrate-binding protein [Aminobacter niigataensis]